MSKKDFRIIKQIRDQFFISTYMTESLSTIYNLHNAFVPDDAFFEEMPISYFIEKELMSANAAAYKVYNGMIKSLFEGLKKVVKEEDIEEFQSKFDEQQKEIEKNRRVMMNISFNLAEKSNKFICGEVVKYLGSIVPQDLLDKEVLKKYNLGDGLTELAVEKSGWMKSQNNKSVMTLGKYELFCELREAERGIWCVWFGWFGYFANNFILDN